MITRYALIAALVVSLAGVTALWWVTGQRDEARAEAARLQRELASALVAIDVAKNAAAVHRVYVDRLTRDNREMSQLLDELQRLDGQNAPLSPLLDTTVDRLWP